MQHPNDCLIQNDDGSYKRIEVGLKISNHTGRQAFSDAIFIDGMHQVEYILRDFNNSVEFLNINGCFDLESRSTIESLL